MTSIALGVIAALAWGVHDLLVRYISARIAIPAALVTVLVIGLFALSPIGLAMGGFREMTARALVLGTASGAFYGVASLALYVAFARGPVKLVAPIIGAYPILSIGWAQLSGSPVNAADWLAVVVIVTGVALVSLLSDPGEVPAQRRVTIATAMLAGAGFAATFALGQAAVRVGAEWPVILLSRGVAIIVVLTIVLLRHRRVLLPAAGQLPILAAMGCLDAAALSLVTLSATLPNAEFSAAAASTFGVVTLVLAKLFLQEPMTAGQWASVALVFGGVAALGL